MFFIFRKLGFLMVFLTILGLFFYNHTMQSVPERTTSSLAHRSYSSCRSEMTCARKAIKSPAAWQSDCDAFRRRFREITHIDRLFDLERCQSLLIHLEPEIRSCMQDLYRNHMHQSSRRLTILRPKHYKKVHNQLKSLDDMVLQSIFSITMALDTDRLANEIDDLAITQTTPDRD